MSQFRVYFYNLETRTEMTDYEGNGKTWLQTGGMVRNKDGEFVQGTTDMIGFCSYGSLSKVVGAKQVTAADFDHAVAVKTWFGPDNIEWRRLVPSDAFASSPVKSVTTRAK